MEEAHGVLSQLRSTTKVYKRACSQVVLLNNKIESAKSRYERSRSVKRLSFKYTNRLELSNLEKVRNMIFAHAAAKCEEIESLQDKLQELTGGAKEFILANYS